MSFRHVAFIQQLIPSIQTDKPGFLSMFNFEQLNKMGANRDNHLYLNDDQISTIPTWISNQTLFAFQQQMNYGNHEMVNM